MVDLSFLENFAKGDKNKMARYINIYLSIAPDIFEKMDENIKANDWEQLRINAHSLKPQADYMGIPALKSVLMEIEQNVQVKKYTGLQVAYEKALSIHADSIPYLKEFILSV